jgi:ribosomal protein L3 glutamine methyltransferase
LNSGATISEPRTARDFVHVAERRFRAARLHYGHGTDTPRMDAVFLVFGALDLPFDCAERELDVALAARDRRRIAGLIGRRIRERLPVAYLLGHAWFAGLKFRVDRRVLIPRSPIAELIENGFRPWLRPARVRRMLDVGTGSGCIAIACAKKFPRAQVDAVDVSAGALAVARRNVCSHRVAGRVRCLKSDLFERLNGRRYDLIVANVPYVSATAYRRLPAEYWHEPGIALATGDGGLAIMERLLREARAHLAPRGVLVGEVGAGAAILARRHSELPFTWLEFEHGGDGVFLLERAQLKPA